MSKPGEPLYMVALKHLATDAKKAGTDLPDAQLNYVPAKKLRTLLEAAAALAPGVSYPAEPELRITGATGKFVVQIKAGTLHFVSWSSSIKAGGKLTPAEIVAAITGEDSEADARGGRLEAGTEPRGFKQSLTIGVLVAAIVAVNSFTVWFTTRPPRTLLPKYTLLQPGPAQRLLADVAGVYETGTAPGDRQLEIQKDGGLRRIKFGAERTVAQRQVFSAKPAEVAGKPALITNRKSLITIKDSLTVVLYGDTYQRVTDDPARAVRNGRTGDD
jgi:hypothetical protein